MAERYWSDPTSLPSFARGLHVLLVDQDKQSLAHLTSLLEQSAYKVTSTEQALNALTMIEEENSEFKLVIADVNMRDIDTLSFLHRLLQRNISVIFMTSELDQKSADEVLAEGACFFLAKPISLEDLKYMWQHVYRKNKKPPKPATQSKEKAKQGKKSKGVTFREPAVAPGPATAEKLQETGDQHNITDPKGKNKIGEPGAGIADVNSETPDPKGKKKIDEPGAAVVGADSARKSHDSDIEFLPAKENQNRGKSGKRKADDETGKQSEEKRANLNSENDNLGNNAVSEERQNDGSSSPAKKTKRVTWTPELGTKFIQVIGKLGDKKASPKTIQKMMGTPNLTLRQVASHLQKYKSQVQRLNKSAVQTLPPPYPYPGSSFRSTNQFQSPLLRQQGITNQLQGSFSSGFGPNISKFSIPGSFSRPELPSKNVANGDLGMPKRDLQLGGLSCSSNSYQQEIHRESEGMNPASDKDNLSDFIPTNFDDLYQLLAGDDNLGSQINTHISSNVTAEREPLNTSDVELPDLSQLVKLLDSSPDLDAFLDLENQSNGLELGGKPEGLQLAPWEMTSGNITSSDNFPADPVDVSQKLDPKFGKNPPADFLNERATLSEYDELLRILDEDPQEYTPPADFDKENLPFAENYQQIQSPSRDENFWNLHRAENDQQIQNLPLEENSCGIQNIHLTGDSNQKQDLPPSEYVHVLKVLEEDPEEFDLLGSGLNEGEVDAYCEWLRQVISGNDNNKSYKGNRTSLHIAARQISDWHALQNWQLHSRWEKVSEESETFKIAEEGSKQDNVPCFM